MDPSVEVLYGKFPRSVAASGAKKPHQFWVFNKNMFDVFFDTAGAKKNTYASVSHFPLGHPPITDKVSFDLDSPMKDAAFPDQIHDQEKLNRMREDSSVANDVLGEVCGDARELSELAKDRDIPIIAVYSGMGIHVHFLFQEAKAADDRFKSTIYKFADVLDLSTVDYGAKDISRILRVPNGRRVDVFNGDEVICDIYTVPLDRDELADVTPEMLLSISDKPRTIDTSLLGDRPEMPLYADYLDSSKVVGPTKEIEDERSVGDAEAEFILDNRIEMPCISERAKQSNPEHYVRFAFAVSLFNSGYSVTEAKRFISSLNWADFDPEKTEKYLKQIHRSGYSRPGCNTMKSQGYCVYPDEPTQCPAYACPSEECKWKR